MRIGHGYDVHRLKEGRKLIIGGVDIPHDKGLDGHSDADVLVHAIMDSMLGALALGDIGKLFPDTDEKWKGVNSQIILKEVARMMDEKGYQIGNVDSLIMIEKPKMAPHIEKMRQNFADALHCSIDQVSVKATRGEKMGFVGREEGVQAFAVVLLEEK